MDYPKREQFFAHRFIRLLTKTAAALEVGSDGCWLLTVIAMQEDACRYTRPVNFFNSQLIQLCHLITEKRLRTLRDRCKNAGWLKYQPSLRRKPGRYMVSIPDHAKELPDGACDEAEEIAGSSSGAIQEQSGNTLGSNRAADGQELGSNRAADGHTSIPSPSPRNPSPSPRVNGAHDDHGVWNPPTEGPTSEHQWNYEKALAYVGQLQAISAKIGPKNWRAWKSLIDTFTLDRVVSAVKAIPASDRWPDKTEESLRAAGSQQPISERVKSKIIKVNV